MNNIEQPSMEDTSRTLKFPHPGSDQFLVSAIVSIYNCERFIEGCLEDLENQTIANKIEIITINSGSLQNEDVIIRRFQEKYNNIVYLKTDDRETIYKSWNRGIKIASGKYITNANADDRHRNDAIEIMVSVMENNPDIGLVYADTIVTRNENESFYNHTPFKYLNGPEFTDFANLLMNGCKIGPQPLWLRKVHDEYGYFDEELKVAGDYEFWLRISRKYKFKHIKDYLGLYLDRPDSAEHTNPVESIRESADIINKYLSTNMLVDSNYDKYTLHKIFLRASENAFWRADFFYSRSRIDLSKKESFRSIKYNWKNMKIYPLLLKCYLPFCFVNFLKKIKTLISEHTTLIYHL
jgi:glycosyltransferase involved in cell wall biosynthesis